MAGPAIEDDDEPITGINIIPLVDIVLVVLIIFMVTASYIVTPAIRVELPKAASGEPVANTVLSLVLTREGELFLNGEATDEAALTKFLGGEDAAALEAVIAADRAVPHGRVVGLIDLVKRAGVVKFAINTEAEFTSQPEAGATE